MMTSILQNFDLSLIPKDKYQGPRTRRALYALYGAMIHTLICVLLWWDNDFRLSAAEFIKIFAAMWVMHIGFFVTIRMGWNRQFKDPSLTAPMMLWAFTCTMYTVYLSYDLREILLMMNLLILVFGVFQLSRSTFLFVTLYGIYLYFVIIVFFTEYSSPMALRKDWVIFLSYTVISLAFTMIASEINTLRMHLHEKNKKLSEALKYIESISITDELTGIKNRRYILNTLETQRLMSERGQYIFSVCMIDIDHFKNINDSHGHMVGDNVLKRITFSVQEYIRKIDYFGRFGGEEFLLVFPFCNIQQAEQAAERIRTEVEKTDFSDIIAGLKPTVSLGVTEYHWPEPIEDVLARVDVALYTAKRNGRNRVMLG